MGSLVKAISTVKAISKPKLAAGLVTAVAGLPLMWFGAARLIEDVPRGSPGPEFQFPQLTEGLPAIYPNPLYRPVGSPKLLVAVPRDASEFVRVYGGLPSAVQRRQLERFDSELADIESSTRLSGGLDQLRSFVSSADSDPVVILAHSESAGSTIVLTDGRRVSAEAVQAICLAEGRACILLTCHSRDLGICGEINLLDALTTYRDGMRMLASDRDDFLVEDFVQEMTRSVQRRELVEQIAVTSAATAGGGGLLYVLLDGRR